MNTSGNDQYEIKQSFFHLERCCQLVGQKFGNSTIATWTNGDYIRLSGILSRQTSIQISPSTLKRIFGKLKTTEWYFPQKATRDALAQFSGFKDWETFVQENPSPVKNEEARPESVESRTEKLAIPVHKNARKRRNWIPVIAVAAGLVVLTILLFSKKYAVAPVNLQGIQFTCNNPEGGNPHSATFSILLPQSFSGDMTNFTVYFGDERRITWRGSRIERKVSSEIVLTHYYEVPGRYYAVLKYKNIPVDTVNVYLKSNGWTATATMEHDTARVYPINNASLFKNGKLLVTTSELFRSGVDTNRTFFVYFANTKPLKINGDNFELTAHVITSQQRPGVRCSQLNIDVFGEKSKHTVMFIKQGCISWANLQFSEIFMNGDRQDLSFIGADLSQGGIVKLRVRNKNVNLLLNEKLVFETPYNFPLNNVYGVKIFFSGIGMVNNLMVRDLKTGELFNDGFIASR